MTKDKKDSDKLAGFTPIGNILKKELSSFTELADKVKEKTRKVVVLNEQNHLVFVFPAIGSLEGIDSNLLVAKGWRIEVQAKGECEVPYNMLSHSFWHCKCSVHHKMLNYCQECNTEYKEYDRDMEYIEDKLQSIFQWEFIVED